MDIKSYSSDPNREILSVFLSFFLRETVLTFEKLASQRHRLFRVSKRDLLMQREYDTNEIGEFH